MTGTDRLRAIAGAWDEWGLGGTLAEIADEIERERAEDCYRMGLDCGTVWRVAADMERHCLGHEGMEDSPVARWARELRYALRSDTSDERGAQKPSWHDHAEAADVTSDAPKVTRDPAEDVSMSAYDLLPADEREAIAWVRDHGGIESVKAQRRESMPRAAYERKKAGFLDHIAECETALGRRREIISKLGHRVSDLTRENAELRRRAMPEGCQWPRFELGELVGFGDDVSRHGEDFEANVIALYRDGSFSLDFWAYSKGERVKRVKRPAVLAADGEPLEVGQTVWDVEDGTEWCVTKVKDGKVFIAFEDFAAEECDPSLLTHRRPVLGADGVPIETCQKMWRVRNGEEVRVSQIDRGEHPLVTYIGEDGLTHEVTPDGLTHAKPEPPDSWQHIEEDAGCTATKYNERRGTIFTTKQQVARDLVRRGERGE